MVFDFGFFWVLAFGFSVLGLALGPSVGRWGGGVGVYSVL